MSLSAMLGFGALAVDIGMQRVADAQVQSAIEAGVLGGAGYLDRTVPGMYLAKDKAVEIANANAVLGEWSVTLADVDVGVWDGNTYTSVDPATLSAGNPLVMDVNAVRIRTGHTNLVSALADAAFKQEHALGTNNVAIGMRRPDQGRARSVPCYLPLAIPDCDYGAWISGAITTFNPPPVEFQMSTSLNDNAGWADPFSSAFGSDDIKQGFANGGCHDDDLELGESLYVKNGQNTTVLDFLGAVLNGTHPTIQPTQWDHDIAPRPPRNGFLANCPKGYYLNDVGACQDPTGKPHLGSLISKPKWIHEPVIQGPVALVTPADCANTSFTGTMPVSGFAWAMIYDAQSMASSAAGMDFEDKNVWVQLDFITEHDFGGDTEEGPGAITGFGQPMLVNL